MSDLPAGDEPDESSQSGDAESEEAPRPTDHEPVSDPFGVEAIAVVPPDTPEPADDKKPSRPFWVEIPILVIVALAIAIVIKTFLVQAFFIPSGSMESTLNIDDRILVNKLAFRFGDPNRGDVVVFDSGQRRDESILEGLRRNIAEAVGLSAPDSDLIKRVIGLPGEELSIADNKVFIDGVELHEPYLKPGTDMADFGPVVVPPDHYFMMGDNRNLSSDSRFTGPVARERLVGRAFVIVWPPGNWSGL